MSRYIDADAIISFVDAGHLRNPLELAWSDNDVVDMIESRPTVDAVPVSYIYERARELKNDDMIYAYTVLNSLIANYRADGERRTE